MESLEFSDEEIERQLAALGYFNVSEDRMRQFKKVFVNNASGSKRNKRKPLACEQEIVTKDLHKLIEHDRSTSGSSSWFTGVSSPSSNSDYSETSEKTKQVRQPALSRFQPHIKCPPREDFTTSKESTTSDTLMKSPLEVTIPTRTAVESSPDALQSTTNQPSTSGIRYRLPLAEANGRYTEPRWSTRRSTEQSTTDENTSTVDHDSDSESMTSSTTDSNVPSKLIRRRKVLRKQSDGTPRVYDESLVDDPSKGLYRIHDVSVDDSDPRLSRATRRHQLPPRPHSTKPSWKKGPDFEAFISPDQPPSFIRPNSSNPHTRNLKKTDPVNRYRQYQDFWTNIKAPGEKSHNALRWEVKAQMMYKEELAPKPQRVYVPNTYVVPTSKKRSALRWEVRYAMENGLPVPTTYDVY